MSLLNYTTTVPVHRTLGQVTELLVKAGARQMMTEYAADGAPTGLTFAIAVEGGAVAFSLPVHVHRVVAVMQKDRRIPPRYRTPEQGERVAWRIMKDWLEAQLAIVATEMVTLDQVMLPYMRTTDGGTFYEDYVAGVAPLPAMAAGSGA